MLQNSSRKVYLFLIAGALGFIVDSFVFFTLTQGFGLSVVWGRVTASAVAILSTWIINRNYAFRYKKSDAASYELIRYIFASLCGASANLATLTVIAPLDEQYYHIPAYIAGVAAGMVVNYTLYNTLVFRQKSG